MIIFLDNASNQQFIFRTRKNFKIYELGVIVTQIVQ